MIGLVGKGQPPKKPEEKRKQTAVFFSPKEREAIDKARKKVNQRFGQFVRNAANEKAEKLNQE